MSNRYKITISYRSIYREMMLDESMDKVRIGTHGKCNIRFDSDQFFEDFYVDITPDNGSWVIGCSDNTYVSPDGIMKLSVKELNHGDSLKVKYTSSNYEILTIGFLIDFDSRNKSYDRVVNIAGVSQLKMGKSRDCEIQLNDELIGSDTVSIYKRDEHFYIKDNGTKYGVYINGRRIKNEARLEDNDFISVTGNSIQYKFSKLFMSNETGVNGLDYIDMPSGGEYPKFNRNTRIQKLVPDNGINVLDPPKMPNEPEKNLAASLIPAIIMLGLVVVLRGFMSKTGGTFVIFSACSMGLGIVTSIFTYVGGKKKYKKDMEQRVVKYNSYIKRKRAEIEAARDEERNILNDIYISSDHEEAMLREFSGDLFDRSKEDDDFLKVRLGVGITPAKREIEYKAQEQLEAEDDLAEIPVRMSEEFKMIERVPVVCDLKEANGIGVTGSDDRLFDIFKVMVFDLCVRHYYNDVKTVFIADEKSSEKMNLIRFLPHAYNDVLGMRNIVCDEKSRNILFEYLYKEMTARKEAKRNTPAIVIFVYDDVGIKRHPISKFLENAKDIGVTFVFFEHLKRQLPQYCDTLIEVHENDQSGVMIDSSDGNNRLEFSYIGIPDNIMEYASMRLSPVYCEEISLESTLTKNISLYQMLNILSVEDLDLRERWSKTAVDKSMAAPIGVKSKNTLVYLDLHDKFHGPHGLVAGTTGSGKSEILQTYILSMATLYHPYEVSFVIIDFKGGGMVNQFRTLPHLVGAITNIDGREIDRSLRSIKAELRKRQRMFAECEVNHIDKYIRKYKSGEVNEPLPHLIVIVDEFAELKAEQPEFMKELISAARIGRSLGVHLILATQKPAGQVNEQIWSNSKFKLCLKVQSQSDSNEVLKSPLAAEIKEPGRAYLQVGNNEIFELFQSAYSGCSAKSDESNIKEFSISEVALSGLKKPVFEQKKPKSASGDETQLSAVVDHIHDYCENNDIAKLPDICLPSLSTSITKNESVRPDLPNYICELGIYDDPDLQYQGPAFIDMGLGNTMIIGSSQYGKTNLLQWIIKDLAEKYTPQELNIYILDFGSMVLKNFESLAHVGGVVTASDDEKLKNLFKLLGDEMAKRKEKLLQVGVSSFSSYKEAGYTDMPQIIVMVDNLTALKELYLNDNDELLHICREGISVGISVVTVNSQLSGIGYKYLSNFANKIALYCIDPNEYSSLFGPCRMRPLATAGRCIIEIDKEYYECQTYLAFNGEKEIERVEEMRAFIDRINKKYTGIKAKVIPVIPKVLDESFMENNYGICPKPYVIGFGLNYSDVSPVGLNLATQGALALCGRRGMGKGNFIRFILSVLEAHNAQAPVQAAIFDDISGKFKGLQDMDIVSKYAVLPEEASELLTEWHGILKDRYDKLMRGELNLNKEPMLLLIVQNNEVTDLIGKDKALGAIYKEMLGKYRSMKFCIIYSEIENAQIAFSAPEPMKMLKDSRNFLIFDDIPNIKLVDIPMQIARQFKKPLETGEAYFVNGTAFAKLKTVLHQK